MKKFTKKRIFKWLFATVFILLGFYKCTVPIFLLPPYDIHCDSISQIISTERNIWYYKPLCDTLILKDSLRDIRFHVRQACAYDIRGVSQIYFRYYLPWIRFYETNQIKIFGVWFDYMALRDKYDVVYGIYYDLGQKNVDQIFAGPCGWDDAERGISYYGKRLGIPLPDTIYFSVYGNPHIYVDKPKYRILSHDDKQAVIHKGFDLWNERRILGQLIFVKTDSVVFENTRNYDRDKLFFKRPVYY